MKVRLTVDLTRYNLKFAMNTREKINIGELMWM